MKRLVDYKRFLILLLVMGCENEVLIDTPPQLELTIVDEDGNRVDNAEVKIYKTLEDWDAQQNPVSETSTNTEGLVLIQNLEPVVYYIYVIKNDLSNRFGIVEIERKLKLNEIYTLIITVSKPN